MAVEPRLWVDGHPATKAYLLQMAAVNYGAVTSFGYAQGGVRGLDMHLERLAASCRELFSCDLDKSLAVKWIAHAVQALDQAWVRVTVTGSDMSLRAPESVEGLRVGVWVSGPSSPLPDGQAVRSIRHLRELPHLKHLGTTGIIHARRQARLEGFDDALLTGEVGMILEGTLWNVGFVRGNTVVWPTGLMLDGVTRRLIVKGLDQAGIPQTSEVVTLSDLKAYDAAFLCNAATPAASIDRIDAHAFAGNPQMIQRLRDAWTSQPVQLL
ncbi:hypothetical protein OB03_09595 [Brevundimonas sp. GN22]